MFDEQDSSPEPQGPYAAQLRGHQAPLAATNAHSAYAISVPDVVNKQSNRLDKGASGTGGVEAMYAQFKDNKRMED